ncbi:hypothetical protein DSL72_005067 [Monilinia vaccinii-corymbosi]|uniref:DUF788 domain protein n=1 Tax=Monilinia vaccinii-corymbosi TaxID=61207 RepID=A0A8A3PEK1_9HELO|nr:hypothetical protein DSL72_005067 [Monilinia vaccinii-corymbosi]
MAQKARKDRAKANIQTLNYLHYGTILVNGLFCLFHVLLRSRNMLAYVLFSIAPWIVEWFLEHNSRPKFDPAGKMVSAGEDLAAPGLTEYMFDIIWMHWLSLFAVVIFGNWGWIIFSAVPIYGLYKAFGLWSGAKGLMGGGQGAQAPEEQVPMAGNRRQRRQ